MNEFQLETAFKDLNLGQNFSAAKNSLRNFKEKIDEFKSLKSDDLFLQEYFARLRNEIDTEREAVQLRTECYYSRLIDEANQLEAKCREESDDKKKSADNVVKQFEEKFKRFRDDLDQMKIDFDSWEKIRKDSNYQIKKLNDSIQSFKSDLLMNKAYVFESKGVNVEVAKIVSTKPLIEKDLKDAFGFGCFTIYGVKKAFEDKNSLSKKIYSAETEFNGNNWYVGIENRENEFVGFYFFREEKPSLEELKVSVTLQLVNKKDPLENITDKFEYKYVDSEGFGFHKFINFQELFDRGFHDVANDSIDVLAYVKVLDN